MSKDTPRSYLLLYLKGIAMGAADVVPGVSGGTIAFIAGIYERLLNALRSFGPQIWLIFRQSGVQGVWRHIDGTFLLVLFGGILTSIVTLASLISHLLEVYPELIWAFFFGLILGSVWLIATQIRQRTSAVWICLVLGTLAAYMITELSPREMEVTLFTLFFSGMIAICAMILPGISGSFILLVMGMYAPILAAVKSLHFSVLFVFACGCVVGLLSISHFLSWMLRRFHDVTLALLTGIMLGSLNKIWPWKQTLEYRLNRAGEEVPFLQTNVLPSVYEVVTGQPSHLTGAILCGVMGIVLIVILEKVRTR